MSSKDSRVVAGQLLAIERVRDVLVLDAGQCVLLIFSTGGFSTYMPQRGITVLDKAGAETVASSYWHKGTFHDKCKELGM